MATYAAVGIVVGTGGMVGKVAPVVVGVAAIPVAAVVLIQVAVGVRRAVATAEASRRRIAASAEFERVRAAAERAHGGKVTAHREALAAAEAELRDLDRRLGQASQTVA